MTTNHPASFENTPSVSALMEMRREKRRERRRRQMEGFFRNMAAQNADKIILLFDSDLNIA